MLLLTREATKKDLSLDSQMLVTTAQNETGTGTIWQKTVFSEMSILILI